MAIRLAVTIGGIEPGCVVAVAGAESSLGEWDPARAVRLNEEAGTWTGEVPMPAVGSEFKLLTLKGAAVEWEPLASNRTWPNAGCGYLLRMQFGEARIAVEACQAQLEANARHTRKMEDRIGSALQHNVDTKNDLAYYHAHNRKFEVPEDAKVISGPGLITGGPPVLIEAGANLDGAAAERTVWLKEYSWSDSTGKVKVYVPISEGVLPADGANDIVETNYGSHTIDLTIKSKPKYKLLIEKLNAELNVESCTTRVEASKNRIVLQLAKKKETTWYNLTKSK